MNNTLRNCLVLICLFLNHLLNTLKVKLGLLKVKYGLMGYFEKEGIIFTSAYNSKRRLEAIKKYDNFRPDDVVLCTYPKSGTHFTESIIGSIYKESVIGREPDMCPLEIIPPPFLRGNSSGPRGDKHSLASMDAAQSPRIIVTHLHWDMLPPKVREGKVKVIHCMRNPKDVVCSAFPFYKKMGILQPEIQWGEFFMYFVSGHVVRGSYMTYLKNWYPNRNLSSMLNLQFEEMKMDLEGNVRKIAEFLGVELTDDQIRRVTVANTFENKKQEMGKGHVMYRTGKSGGWKSTLTVEQNEIMSEWIEAEMKEMEHLNLRYE